MKICATWAFNPGFVFCLSLLLIRLSFVSFIISQHFLSPAGFMSVVVSVLSSSPPPSTPFTPLLSRRMHCCRLALAAAESRHVLDSMWSQSGGGPTPL